jgi:hypothetical protein
MEPLLKIKLIGYLLRISGVLLWLNRAFYRSSLASARNGLILLFAYAILLGLVPIDSAYLKLASGWHEIILIVAFCPVFILCGYLLLGLYSASIVKVDFGASTGISFAQSMNRCTKSFRFLGVGAAKLTVEEDAFRAMAARCIQNGRSPQFLLCDPASPVIEKLEGIAQVRRKNFSGKVEKSYAAIRAIEGELAVTLDIRQYLAADYDAMPLFRLIFIDDEYCLASGGHYGKANHGVDIPQLLISRDQSPALFTALDRYFTHAWAKGTPWDRTSTRG